MTVGGRCQLREAHLERHNLGLRATTAKGSERLWAEPRGPCPVPLLQHSPTFHSVPGTGEAGDKAVVPGLVEYTIKSGRQTASFKKAAGNEELQRAGAAGGEDSGRRSGPGRKAGKAFLDVVLSQELEGE